MWAFFVLLFKSESLEYQMRKYAFCMLAFFNKQQKGVEMSKYVVNDRFFPHSFLISRLLPSPYPYWGDEEDVQSPPRDPFVG